MKHIGVLESNLSGSGFEGLKVAKELGHRVTFFTRDLDRYLAVPGGARYFDDYVDEIVLCETNEFASVMHKVRQMDPFHPFAGFLTLGDYDVVVAAGVASELGLQAPDPGAVTTARNKALMRRRCAAAGVPMPRFAQVTTYEQAVAAGREIGTPCVVKPADETSGSDVRRCSSVDEVTAHFLTIATKSSNARGQRRGYPKVLVEECVPGFEVSVEVLAMGEGRFHVFGVTDKTIGGHNHFVELGHLFPSQLDGRIVARCEEVAVDALRAVGFDLGMAHVEVRYNLTSGPALIEINPRPPGGRITDLIDLSLDVRCLELVVRQYLGEHIRDDLPSQATRGAAVRYLTADPGTIVSITGTEVAAGIKGVVQTEVYAAVGERVRPLRRNHDRIGHVLAVAGNAYLAGRLAEAGAHEIAVITR